MKVLAIIPARGGSKGVPGKNYKLLGDKPLITYTIEKAKQCHYFSKIIVSTDSEDIIAIAKQYEIEVPFIRPNHLATDEASSIDVVNHAVNFFEAQNELFDAICLLQPTTPFRSIGFIDVAIQKFINENVDALVSVLPVPHEFNPHWVFELNSVGMLQIATGDKDIITRRQDLPPAYFRDGSIYITKTSIIKSGSFYGSKLSFIENDPEFYVNIDTLKDWEIAEAKLNMIKDRL